MAELGAAAIGFGAVLGAAAYTTAAGFVARHETNHAMQVTEIRRHITDFEAAYGRGEVTEDDWEKYLAIRTEARTKESDYEESIEAYKDTPLYLFINKWTKRRQVRKKKKSLRRANRSLRSHYYDSTSDASYTSSTTAESGSPPQSRSGHSGEDNERILSWAEEAKRLQHEAEKQRRILADKCQRDQAWAVMHKRNQSMQNSLVVTDTFQRVTEEIMGIKSVLVNESTNVTERQGLSNVKYTKSSETLSTIKPTSSRLLQQKDTLSRNGVRATGVEAFIGELVIVHGIPSVYHEKNQWVLGSCDSSSERSYTPLKLLGDHQFATVFLCDWHDSLPPAMPLPAMQSSPGARREWAGKRLVVVKKIKITWKGGWEECHKLRQLEAMRELSFHPNIIPLVDVFLLPDTKILHFVFEPMEGNLRQLIKSRKGRAMAGGLVANIFRQMISGLDHMHTADYFHRSLTPNNVLVTTTGLFNYNSLSLLDPLNAPKEKDITCIIKLDFGLPRESNDESAYPEHTVKRWYRAPEVLLFSPDCSKPADIWALGAIMAELVNLKPLFPGTDHLDQLDRICGVLGDPSPSVHAVDVGGGALGRGAWPAGVMLARTMGFRFPKMQPQDLHSLFERTVPVGLVDCIRDLLRFDPEMRLTSRQCLEHPYLLSAVPQNNIPLPSHVSITIL